MIFAVVDILVASSVMAYIFHAAFCWPALNHSLTKI
jgi:hypothetical protein